MASADSVAAKSQSSLSVSMRLTVYGIQKVFPMVRNVSCDRVQQWMATNTNKSLICLDVRPEEEYKVSHMPGAVRVEPSSQPSLDALNVTPKSRVICYCSVGYRSSNMAQHLFRAARSTGHSIEVYNMEGGLFQWAMEGRELVDSTERTTSLVHPYSVVFGKLLPQNLRAAL